MAKETETRLVEQEKMFPLTDKERVLLHARLVKVDGKLDDLVEERKQVLADLNKKREDFREERRIVLHTLRDNKKSRRVKVKVKVKKPVAFSKPKAVGGEAGPEA
jgi:hypothetical protein